LHLCSIEVEEVEHLLRACILDGQIAGHIDQVGQLLVLQQSAAGDKRYEAIDKWSAQLHNLMKSVSSKLAA
jgi:COP9 signalosome complex subunit 2